MIEQLTVLFCGASMLALVATFLWARPGQLRQHLFAGLVMGPTIAALGMVFFNIGARLYTMIQHIGLFRLSSPGVTTGLRGWLSYSTLAATIPLLAALLILVIFGILHGIGVDHLLHPFDSLNSIFSGGWLSDALGCITLGSLLLGVIPYGFFYALFGALLAALSRVSGANWLSLTQVIAFVTLTAFLWVTSLASAVQRQQ